jgi:TRAP-type C4-dicarboxylate transport system permease small subunit
MRLARHYLALLLKGYNRAALFFSMVAMVVTSLLLTYSVITRYFFRVPTDWQDEVSVFMLIGVIFFSCAYVQSVRGHIAIEALDFVLPHRLNVFRYFLVDLVSFLFCAFFTWKSWTLLQEAWNEGR